MCHGLRATSYNSPILLIYSLVVDSINKKYFRHATVIWLQVYILQSSHVVDLLNSPVVGVMSVTNRWCSYLMLSLFISLFVWWQGVFITYPSITSSLLGLYTCSLAPATRGLCIHVEAMTVWRHDDDVRFFRGMCERWPMIGPVIHDHYSFLADQLWRFYIYRAGAIILRINYYATICPVF